MLWFKHILISLAIYLVINSRKRIVVVTHHHRPWFYAFFWFISMLVRFLCFFFFIVCSWRWTLALLKWWERGRGKALEGQRGKRLNFNPDPNPNWPSIFTASTHSSRYCLFVLLDETVARACIMLKLNLLVRTLVTTWLAIYVGKHY